MKRFNIEATGRAVNNSLARIRLLLPFVVEMSFLFLPPQIENFLSSRNYSEFSPTRSSSRWEEVKVKISSPINSRKSPRGFFSVTIMMLQRVAKAVSWSKSVCFQTRSGRLFVPPDKIPRGDGLFPHKFKFIFRIQKWLISAIQVKRTYKNNFRKGEA